MIMLYINSMDNTITIQNFDIIASNSSYKEIIERFLSAQDITLKSKQTYQRALKQFFLYLQVVRLENIKRENLLEYKRSMSERGLSPYTVSCYITAVRKFFEWTDSEGLYPNIAKNLKGAKKPKGFRKEALTVSQVKDVLTIIKRDSIQGKRDFALLNLLVRTGLRTIEIIRSNIGDIKQEGGEAILYIQGKGRETKDDFVLLTDETLKPIREYLSSRTNIKEEEPLFSSLSCRNNGERLTTRSISRIVKESLIEAGLNSSKLTAHSFRHTAVTFCLLGGSTIQEAQSLARHSNINTTLIYAHNIERIGNAPERKIDKLLSGII